MGDHVLLVGQTSPQPAPRYSQDEITVGVVAFRDEEELTVGKLLALPFKEQRPWKLPTGEVPERGPKPAKELRL